MTGVVGIVMADTTEARNITYVHLAGSVKRERIGGKPMDELYQTYEATVRIGEGQYKTQSTYPTHSGLSQEWIEHDIKEGFVRWLVKELNIQIEQVDY